MTDKTLNFGCTIPFNKAKQPKHVRKQLIVNNEFVWFESYKNIQILEKTKHEGWDCLNLYQFVSSLPKGKIVTKLPFECVGWA